MQSGIKGGKGVKDLHLLRASRFDTSGVSTGAGTALTTPALQIIYP